MQRLMKTTKILFIAAAAVAMTLASCTKEQTGTTENGQTSGLRTLTVSFATSPTRTTLDGLQPKWKADDQIYLADGTGYEVYTVTTQEEGEDVIKITTALTGNITAVYPSSAAVTEQDGKNVTGVKVGASQDGSFGSANICMATAAAGTNALSFENKTAVINVVVPDGTKKLTITSLKPVGTSGQRTETAVAIADGSATTITVGNGSSNIPNPCYVSILAPETGAVLLQDLNVDVDDKAQGGFSPSAIVAKGKTPSSYAVEANTIYTLSKESLHEYITVDGKKWATMNVGATEANPNGLYFAWGETTGHAAATNGDSAFTNAYSGNEDGFSWTNCPLSNHDEDDYHFSKYVPEGYKTDYGIDGYYDDKDTLDLEDDAAFWNWGGAWRMPTQGEFATFISDASYTSGNFEYKDVPFPAAGFGDGSVLNGAGGYGDYWSSSLDAGGPRDAFFLSFSDGDISADYYSYRYSGFSVRPLSE